MLTRLVWKRTLSLARIRLLVSNASYIRGTVAHLVLQYTRITLTRFTTAYFFLAVITCAVLSSLQAVTFADNSDAISLLGRVLDGQPPSGLIILENGKLRECNSLPNQPGTICTEVMDLHGDFSERSVLEDISLVWLSVSRSLA